ncbi:MAG: GTP 3',8-cyclase MoaA [Planctomycetota bacterium]
MIPPEDRLGRPLRNLRLSVTDRCNLRCAYCMPENDYSWLPRESVLTYEEMARISSVFVGLGVDRIRLTGGEPLLRRDIERLVAMLSRIEGLRDLAMTTNGVLLADRAEGLKAAGLRRVTVSLDTLDESTFRLLSRRSDHARVLSGIEAARRASFAGLKLDTVAIAGVNDHEIPDLLDFARGIGAEIRFIEYMDVGGATGWRPEAVVSREEILRRIGLAFGTAEPLQRADSAPAERFRLPDGTVFGVISSVTRPFCRDCDRSRVTADGMWFRCLYAQTGFDLRSLVRSGAPDERIAAFVADRWRAREDRGAEERQAAELRTAYAARSDLRRNPHLEMHKRGG